MQLLITEEADGITVKIITGKPLRVEGLTTGGKKGAGAVPPSKPAKATGYGLTPADREKIVLSTMRLVASEPGHNLNEYMRRMAAMGLSLSAGRWRLDMLRRRSLLAEEKTGKGRGQVRLQLNERGKAELARLESEYGNAEPTIVKVQPVQPIQQVQEHVEQPPIAQKVEEPAPQPQPRPQPQPAEEVDADTDPMLEFLLLKRLSSGPRMRDALAQQIASTTMQPPAEMMALITRLERDGVLNPFNSRKVALSQQGEKRYQELTREFKA